MSEVNTTYIEFLLELQISPSGDFFVQVNITNVTDIFVAATVGRRAMLQSGGIGVQVDAIVTYASVNQARIASKLTPGAAWSSGFCFNNEDVGCTGVKIISQCNTLTPCKAPPDTSTLSKTLPVTTTAPIIASVLGFALLVVIGVVVWRRRRGRLAMDSDGDKEGAEKPAGDEAYRPEDNYPAPTRGQQLLSHAASPPPQSWTPVSSPQEQFWTPQKTPPSAAAEWSQLFAQ